MRSSSDWLPVLANASELPSRALDAAPLTVETLDPLVFAVVFNDASGVDVSTLDDQDIVLHTLFDSPKEQAIADSGYADTTVELRRWK